jgi:hypothetical protein
LISPWLSLLSLVSRYRQSIPPWTR